MLMRVEWAMLKSLSKISCVSLCALVSSQAISVEKTIELQSTFIGDREQPGVSYIMPWKPPEGPEGLYRPIDSISNNVLDPLERDLLIHSVHYYEQMALEQKKKK